MQPNNSSAYLIIRQGHRWTDVFRLEPARPLIIGRASSNEIPVADERSSRRHAEIFFTAGNWQVRDLGSRNGTFVDGVRIEEPRVLAPGNQVVVASCRMTFAHSLDEIVPPLEPDEPSPKTSSNTQEEIAPAITYRQSKASLLDSQSFQPSSLELPGNHRSTPFESADSNAAPITNSSKTIGPPVALELFQLAFDLAKQPTVTAACDLALHKLLISTGCQSGGILRFEEPEPKSKKHSELSSISILAARERSGRAYHPVTEAIIAAVRRDSSAILARNVASDQQLVGGSATPQASHVHSTTSVIAAPLRIDNKMIGMVHLYSRIGEPDLTPDDLEIALAVADVLSVSLDNLQRQQSLETKLHSSRTRITELEQQLGHGEWVGKSPTMKQVRDQVTRVAPTQATVLIRGESGTGKELISRAIHDQSTRASGPFIAINCAALTPTLLESELFGHEKGAFTGATERKLGKFELANGGSIMLDELGEMSLEIQAKFLRVLEGKSFERVGGSKPIQTDVRVIAATNKDLEAAVKEGEFRSDLYFRLRVIELRVPALRDRPEDVMPLAEFFLQQFYARSGQGPKGFSDRAKQAMMQYSWPGNVRELRNCVERAHVLATGPLAEPEDLALSYLQVPGQSTSQSPQVTPVYRERTIDEVEREHIAATLEYTGGQKNRAAAILGIERSTLDRKLKRASDVE